MSFFRNIADMKQQLIDLNLFFDWKRVSYEVTMFVSVSPP